MTNRTTHHEYQSRTEGTSPPPQKQVIGPLGKHMSLKDLPAPGTKRWVIRRKAEVVAGVRGGLLTLEEACSRYSLSVDEFRSWQRLLKSHGVQGLRTTKTKTYRHRMPGRPETDRPR